MVEILNSDMVTGNMAGLVGELTGGSSGNRVKRKLDGDNFASLQLFKFNHCDLSHHFSTTQQVCQKLRLKENWIIKWNVREVPFIESMEAIITQNLGSANLSVCSLDTLNLKTKQ